MNCININCNRQKFAKQLCKSCYDKWYRSTFKGKERRKLAQEKVRNTENRKIYTKNYNTKYKNRRNKLRSVRYNTDINYKLSENLRKRINKAIKNNQKSGSAIKDLGCSIEQFKIYIESKFQSGMTWDNYGRKPGVKCWEIDHVKPLNNFDLTSSEEFKKAAHFSNLQPMWAEDNNKKRAKYFEENIYESDIT